MADNAATLKNYMDQWDDCFKAREPGESMLGYLRSLAFDGKLRGCNFRSVCWRIFLNCLSPDPSTWEKTVKLSRESYQKIKDAHICNPSCDGEKKDLDVENPLSQNDESSWNQFFKDSDLKMTIQRDVRRTFPEMEYFHDAKVHTLLVDVLFCYACEHRDLSYRQGMHELLAPLVFIIHCDLQAACSAKERGTLPDLIDFIFQETYLEHDSYDMFCHLMQSTNDWYSVSGSEEEDLVASAKSCSITVEKPFQPRSVPSNGTLAINDKLNQIYHTLLVKHDLQLHTHLNGLEIIPQVFGLRWIRLLFGREFPLQDLLVLWDALFADSSTLDLVDYLFVAMLIHVRDKLLDSDYSTCLQLLMKFPPIDDINDIVKAAKHLRQGVSYPEWGNDDNTAPGRTVMPSKPAKMLPVNNGKQNSFVKVFRDFTRRAVNPSNQSVFTTQRHLSDLTSDGRAKPSPPTLHRLSHGHNIDRNVGDAAALPNSAPVQNKKRLSIQEEKESLRRSLDEMRQMCDHCSGKLDACTTALQSSVRLRLNSANQKHDSPSNDTTNSANVQTDDVEQTNYERDQILITIATLKQVRDLLKGTVKFNPNLPEYKSNSEFSKT